jgi:hypothetical protein
VDQPDTPEKLRAGILWDRSREFLGEQQDMQKSKTKKTKSLPASLCIFFHGQESRKYFSRIKRRFHSKNIPLIKSTTPLQKRKVNLLVGLQKTGYIFQK